MKCKFCGSEWQSASEVRSCPFCGEPLAEPLVFSDIEQTLCFILDTYGERICSNPNSIVSYLGDLAPGLENERRLLKMCANAGIIAELFTATDPAEKDLAAKRAVTKLSGKYFLDVKWAETAVGWLTVSIARTSPGSGESSAAPAPPEREVQRLRKRRGELKRDAGRLACGYSHILGLRSDGRVVAYGQNDCGQCNVEDWRSIAAIACGHRVSVGLTADHTAFSTNLSGSRYPWQGIVQIGALTDYPVGLCADGKVMCGQYIWGLGQCTEPYCRKCAWMNGRWEGIAAVFCGWGENFFLLSDGSVAACHPEEFEQGIRNWRNIVSIAAGDAIYGLTNDGRVFAQGDNKYGECNVSGWRNIVDIAAGPRRIIGLTSAGRAVYAGEDEEEFQVLGTWTDLVAVACGGQFAAGLKADGTVVTCGRRDCINTSGWRDIVAITCGTAYVAGLQADGTVVVEGVAFFGEDRIAGQNLFH